ncbi:MAG: DUF4321 domain-containing protein [Chitinivibrionales bacterium]|nr:DUF4321 domain-containing protein [Chitinivibrionales bacterium]MBD3395964.1 DUF4321 domain-containing protein [Chitinivibrionales bacterium]
MAIALKEKNFWTLVLVVIVGIIIGSYFNSLIRALIPGENNVVKTFFTTNVTFGVGDFGDRKGIVVGVDDANAQRPPRTLSPLMLDLSAIKFQLGLQVSFSFMSVAGVFLSLYFFRWYR